LLLLTASCCLWFGLQLLLDLTAGKTGLSIRRLARCGAGMAMQPLPRLPTLPQAEELAALVARRRHGVAHPDQRD